MKMKSLEHLKSMVEPASAQGLLAEEAPLVPEDAQPPAVESLACVRLNARRGALHVPRVPSAWLKKVEALHLLR